LSDAGRISAARADGAALVDDEGQEGTKAVAVEATRAATRSFMVCFF